MAKKPSVPKTQKETPGSATPSTVSTFDGLNKVLDIKFNKNDLVDMFAQEKKQRIIFELNENNNRLISMQKHFEDEENKIHKEIITEFERTNPDIIYFTKQYKDFDTILSVETRYINTYKIDSKWQFEKTTNSFAKKNYILINTTALEENLYRHFSKYNYEEIEREKSSRKPDHYINIIMNPYGFCSKRVEPEDYDFEICCIIRYAINKNGCDSFETSINFQAKTTISEDDVMFEEYIIQLKELYKLKIAEKDIVNEILQRQLELFNEYNSIERLSKATSAKLLKEYLSNSAQGRALLKNLS